MQLLLTDAKIRGDDEREELVLVQLILESFESKLKSDGVLRRSKERETTRSISDASKETRLSTPWPSHLPTYSKRKKITHITI